MRRDETSRYAEFHPEVWSPRPGSWTIEAGPPDNGWVNNADRQCSIPFPYTDVQDHIRLHEAHHVLLTPLPADVKEGYSMTQLMVEENRVDAFAYEQWVDVHYRHDLVDPKTFLESFDQMDERTCAHYVMQFAPTYADRGELVRGKFIKARASHRSVVQLFEKFASKVDGEKLKEVKRIIMSIWDTPDDETCIQAAVDFDALFPAPPKPKDGNVESPPNGFKADENGQYERIEKAEPKDCGTRQKITVLLEGNDGEMYEIPEEGRVRTKEQHEKLSEKAEEKLKRVIEMVNQRSKSGDWNGVGGRDRAVLQRTQIKLRMVKSQYQTMQIVRLILPCNKSGAVANPKGSAERGAELGDITRWWQDKRIFKGSQAGGTIIIDISGSMKWDWNVLRDTIHELPAMTIGIFSSCHFVDEQAGTPKGINGRMAIIAEKGRWIDPQTAIQNCSFGGSNAIDLDSLEWLAAQKGPRLWLGDGQIHTGRLREKPYDNDWDREIAWTYIRALSQRHRIVRTTDVRAAVKYMRNGGRISVPGVYPWNSRQFKGKVVGLH